MRKLSESDLDKIFGSNLQELHQKLIEWTLEEEQLTTEDRYQLSPLATYFELDSWESDQALLLLCGIDPEGVLIDQGFSNYMGGWIDRVKIEHAKFFGELDMYDTPSEGEIHDSMDDCKKTIEILRTQIEEFIKYDDVISSDADFIPKRKEQIATADEWLKKFEEWLYDELNIKVWSIRSEYAGRLTRFRKLWKSGNHKIKNSQDYYINWALGKKLEIPWLEWAKNRGYISLASECSNERPTTKRNRDLQKSANSLATKWKDEGRKSFSKRDIAKVLASGDEWSELTESTIERLIKIKW